MTLQNAAKAAAAGSASGPRKNASYEHGHFNHRPVDMQVFVSRVREERSRARYLAGLCRCLEIGVRRGVLDLDRARDFFARAPRVKNRRSPFRAAFMEAVMRDAPRRRART